MTFFQRFIVHPVTALLLAVSGYAFVAHYELLQFSSAPLVFAVTVAMGYLLLSRKYDPILSYVCLSFALFVSYKAATIPSRSLARVAPVEDRIYRDLSLQMAVEQLKTMLPEFANLKLQSELSNADFTTQFCGENSCPEPFVMQAKLKDKKLTEYGLTADFHFFRRNQTGDIEEIFE